VTVDPGYLAHLYDVVMERRNAAPDQSYVAALFAKGKSRIAQKVGEEAVETAIAAVSESREALISESADLLFHMLILWADAGIRPEDVLQALQQREGTSGLAEKRNRSSDS